MDGENMKNVILMTPMRKDPDGKVRVGAYCRVSSNSKDQLHSYANQINYYRDYINRHENWELADIFADEGVTGTKVAKRTEFARMIKECEAQRLDLIVTKSVTRFARNTKDALEYVRKLKLLGIGVIFEEQAINTLTLADEMLLSMFAAIAQEESVSISQNQRLSITKRMERGEYVDSNAPYGFRLVDKKLVEYPPESETVKRVFRDYLNGHSSTEIAHMLEADGIRTKSGLKKWKSTTVTYLLSNEKYIGDSLFQKTFRTVNVPFKQSKNRQNEDQYYANNTHEGFIDKDTFEKVQMLLGQRKQQHMRTTTYNTYPLTSHIRCAECGSSFRRRVIGGGIAWACTKHLLDKNACDSHYYREERIYDAFAAMVNKLRFGNTDILDETDRTIVLALRYKRHANTAMAEIEQKMTDFNEQLHRIEQLRSKGYLDYSAYQKQVSEINRCLTNLKERRAEAAESKLERMLEEIRTLKNRLEEIEEPLETYDESIFTAVVKEMFIDKNDTITFRILGDLNFTEQL